MTGAVHIGRFGDPPAIIAGEAIADRRDLALVAFERTRMPMVMTDPRLPDNPIVMANQAFLDLTGYTAGEVIGRNCRFLQGPHTSAADVDDMRDALAIVSDFSVEVLNYRKDGTPFWNQVMISPVMDEKGELLYFFGSQKDVSEQRRAQELEAAERLLLMEVDHRTMNAMALVQSIVRLSCPRDAPPYAAKIQSRVDSLARAHRLLAHNRWADADFKDVLALETARHRDRIDAQGAAMSISAHVVQPVALVLHEMLSNAVEHGALSQQDGGLTVRWRAEDDHAILSWHERGVFEPAGAPEPGFGLNMVRGVIERQLGGTAALEWTSSGLGAELTFPQGGQIGR